MDTMPSLPRPVTSAVSSAFGFLARVRGDRALHPKGDVWRASVRADPAGQELTGGDCEAIVRCSRAVGLPGWLPDVHGVALRLLRPEPVDILLATSSRRVPWALLPSFDKRGTYSSLAHYLLDGQRVRIIGDPGKP